MDEIMSTINKKAETGSMIEHSGLTATTGGKRRIRVVSFASSDDDEDMDEKDDNCCDMKSFKPSVFLHAKKQCLMDGFFDDIDKHLDDLIFGINAGNSHENAIPLEVKDTCHMSTVLQSFLSSPISRDYNQFCTMIETMEAEKEGEVEVEEIAPLPIDSK